MLRHDLGVLQRRGSPLLDSILQGPQKLRASTALAQGASSLQLVIYPIKIRSSLEQCGESRLVGAVRGEQLLLPAWLERPAGKQQGCGALAAAVD